MHSKLDFYVQDFLAHLWVQQEVLVVCRLGFALVSRLLAEAATSSGRLHASDAAELVLHVESRFVG